MSCVLNYLVNGRFEIDHNLVENVIRPVKLGAKNGFLFGSKEAGHPAAVISPPRR